VVLAAAVMEDLTHHHTMEAQELIIWVAVEEEQDIILPVMAVKEVPA
jgi:hypothetical protein